MIQTLCDRCNGEAQEDFILYEYLHTSSAGDSIHREKVNLCYDCMAVVHEAMVSAMKTHPRQREKEAKRRWWHLRPSWEFSPD